MSEEVAMAVAIALGGMIVGFFLVAVTMWVIAEWDERKWRKRMNEIEEDSYSVQSIQEKLEADRKSEELVASILDELNGKGKPL